MSLTTRIENLRFFLKRTGLWSVKIFYAFLRPIIFLSDSEFAHTCFVKLGACMGRNKQIRRIIQSVCLIKSPTLSQILLGINFKSPIGLAAGFDYQAQLPHILPSLGFGFETVGTITRHPYDGNPRPRLGRLKKSRSLLVNKGFKNDGIEALIQKHQNSCFQIPIGLSIGKTNTEAMTQKEAVQDIVEAFYMAEESELPISYYELNISCPNLHGAVEFYSKNNLTELLEALAKLRLQKPLFLKMPISESDESVKSMIDVAMQFAVQGLIFGNLQKDRSNPALNPSEVSKVGRGNFSGKPTWNRSNELIELAYKYTNGKILIVGCGGIFSAEDAYHKIGLGASVVQLVTGLIYEGPQLVAEINAGLVELLRRDGFESVGESVGWKFKSNFKSKAIGMQAKRCQI